MHLRGIVTEPTIYCSRITVAHVDINTFAKNHFNFFQFVLTGWTQEEICFYLKTGMVISYVENLSILRETLSA